MNEQAQKEKRMEEGFKKLSPELKEKVMCFAEGLKMAQIPKTETKTA